MGVRGNYSINKEDIESAIERLKSSDKESLSKSEFCKEVGGSLSAVSDAIMRIYNMGYEELIAYKLPHLCSRLPRFERPDLFLGFLCEKISEYLSDSENVDVFKLTQSNLNTKLVIVNMGRSARHMYPKSAELKQAIYDWFEKNKPELRNRIE